MKRLICFLIAFGSFPTALNAESVWLILRLGNSGIEGGARLQPVAIEKIEMQDMDQCQTQGALLKSSQEMNEKSHRIGFVCIEGK